MAVKYVDRPRRQSSIADNQAQGGSIRGFLNDGTTEYKNHHSVDSLAFGHCDYAYRNLGRPSQLQIKQQSDFFEVVVDGKSCFKSDKVRPLPHLSHTLLTEHLYRSSCLRTTSSASPPPQPKLPTHSKSTASSYPPPPPPRVKNPIPTLRPTPLHQSQSQTTKQTTRPQQPSRRTTPSSPTCTAVSWK